MKIFQNKKLVIFVGVVVAVVLLTLVLISTGALKFNFTVSSTKPSVTTDQPSTQAPAEDKPLTKMPTQEVKLATRPTTFKDAGGNLEFSINLPVGWATAEDNRVDFVAASVTGEKFDNGQTFYANVNAVSGKHPSGVKTFSDYQAKWKDVTLEQYPSMEFITDYSTKINDMDVYVFEVSNARADGFLLRQIQYVFFVNDDYALVMTGTTPLNSWTSYEDVIKKSVESVKPVSN